MKRYLIILFFNVLSLNLLAKNGSDSIVLSRINELQMTIDSVAKLYNTSKHDFVSISVAQLDELTKAIDKDKDWWQELSPSLIAIVIVLISTGGAILIGIRQIRAQTSNAEDQIRSQEAQAQDNLRMSREQIQETSKMTLAQVRANNISQARINWIQDLRNELSLLNAEIAAINYYLRQVVALHETDKYSKAKEIYDAQAESIVSVDKSILKVRLFLNENELNHKELEDLLEKYYKSALESFSEVNKDFTKISKRIVDTSRTILKEAWEQAKNEGQ